MQTSGLLVGNQPTGGGDDGDAQSVKHPRELIGTDILPQTGTADAFQIGNRTLFGDRVILQCNLDDSGRFVVLKLVIQNITFLEKDLGDVPFQFGSGDLHHLMVAITAFLIRVK